MDMVIMMSRKCVSMWGIFCKGKILPVFEGVGKYMDKGIQLIIVCLDFLSFDTTAHQKLSCYRIRG